MISMQPDARSESGVAPWPGGVAFLMCGRNCLRWLDRCVQSLLVQHDPSWRAFIVDDDSSDGSRERLEGLAAREPRLTILSSHHRRFTLGSRLAAAAAAIDAGAEILVALDLDDWLHGRGVVGHLRSLYADPEVWLTYGSFRKYEPQRHWLRLRRKLRPARPYSVDEFEGTGLRQAPWLATHLRSWRADLMLRLERSWLRADDGGILTACEDQALMFPMLEMAGHEHARFVRRPLYVYNAHGGTIANSRRSEQTSIETMLRARGPVSRLVGLPRSTEQERRAWAAAWGPSAR